MSKQNVIKNLNYFNEVLYLRIFYHSVKNEALFSTIQEFVYTNTHDKYSILAFIDESFQTEEGLYEFIIYYPDTQKYGHWTQSILPLNAYPDSDVNVDIKDDSTWRPDTERIPFVGLHRSSNINQTFIEGVNTSYKGHNEWFYSIGLRQLWVGKIPGYYVSSQSASFMEVSLWLRLSNYYLLKKIPLFNIKTCVHKNLYILPTNFVFILFLTS